MGYEAAVARLVAALNNVVIDETPYFSVHSGVVQIGDQIVAFPAESGHGKTTLTAAALQAGARYLSDEALVFDDDGSVVPYPKPLALAPRSLQLLELGESEGERMLTAEDLGSTVAGPARLRHLVIAGYGSDQIELTPLPRSAAVATLIELSFNHFKDPGRAFQIATQVAREVDVWRLDYDDPKEAIDLLVESLS